MRRSILIVVWVAVLLAVPAAHAMDMYVSIVGAAQGPFRGELTAKGLEGKFSINNIEWGAEVPRDPSTGALLPRRVYVPVAMEKAWGAASYQLYAAMLRNELLTVTIEFVAPNPLDGTPMLDHAVRLTGATVTKFRTSSGRGESPNNDVEFIFQRIDVTDVKTKVTQTDTTVK